MTSGQDPELATIFREMRRAMGVSRERLAGRLATSVETIDVLENGNLLALPDWQEVSRIVTAYSAQLGLDARPILRRMKGQIDALGSVTPNPAASEPPAVPIASQPAGPSIDAPPVQPTGMDEHGSGAEPAPMQPDTIPGEVLAAPDNTQSQPTSAMPDDRARGAEGKGRIARFMRTVANWIVMLCFVGGLGYGLWYASQHPKAVWDAVDSLPQPIPNMMRNAWELVRPLDQPEPRPQIFDPENRKSDKLP